MKQEFKIVAPSIDEAKANLEKSRVEFLQVYKPIAMGKTDELIVRLTQLTKLKQNNDKAEIHAEIIKIRAKTIIAGRFPLPSKDEKQTDEAFKAVLNAAIIKNLEAVSTNKFSIDADGNISGDYPFDAVTARAELLSIINSTEEAKKMYDETLELLNEDKDGFYVPIEKLQHLTVAKNETIKTSALNYTAAVQSLISINEKIKQVQPVSDAAEKFLADDNKIREAAVLGVKMALTIPAVIIPAVDAVEAVPAVLDEAGNIITPAVDAVEAQPEQIVTPAIEPTPFQVFNTMIENGLIHLTTTLPKTTVNTATVAPVANGEAVVRNGLTDVNSPKYYTYFEALDTTVAGKNAILSAIEKIEPGILVHGLKIGSITLEKVPNGNWDLTGSISSEGVTKWAAKALEIKGNNSIVESIQYGKVSWSNKK